MANTISTDLQIDSILSATMKEMREKVPALNLFSTVFSDQPLLGTDKMVVPYTPRRTAAAKQYSQATGYQFDEDTATTSKDITIDQRAYHDLSFTSSELARQPYLDVNDLGKQAADKITEEVFTNILSVATAANFPTATPPHAANAFFVDDLQDIDTQCDGLKWSRSGRGMILNHNYDGNILKDAKLHQDAYGSNNAMKEARLPRISGFDIASTQYIPNNGENLVGMAVLKSAILVGFSPIPPKDRTNTVLYRRMTDPDGSGLTLEYREWFDPNFDRVRSVIEANYGFGLGEGNAMVRIVSA